MSVGDAIATAAEGREVPAAELEAAFDQIVAGEATPAQIAALLVAIRVRGESVAEIVALARALRRRAVTFEGADPRTVDVCGTGGSGIDTFNVSTTAAFVVAAAGVPVAKHGNRAASSAAGSFDALEALGVRIDLPIEACGAVLAEVGVAPFFARTAHPAFRYLAPVRAELGIRTLLNCVGPLLNPAGVRYQLVGVYAERLVEPLARALVELGSRRVLVVHGSDGLDELTTTGPSSAVLAEPGEVRRLEIAPEALGLERAAPHALRGAGPEENARTTRAILDGETGPRRDIVLLNAAAALWAAGAVADLADGLVRAGEAVDSGGARQRLDALVEATRKAGAAA